MFAFAPPATPSLPIASSEAHFPVHRIYCVGRNFADHAIETGHDPNKEPPFFFQKNPDIWQILSGSRTTDDGFYEAAIAMPD